MELGVMFFVLLSFGKVGFLHSEFSNGKVVGEFSVDVLSDKVDVFRPLTD